MRFFLTWWGALVLSALDSSLVFFMPLGVDALVIYLVARNADLFWLYPLLATAGSVAGGAVTFWIGRKAGEVGLPRFVPKKRLQRIRKHVQQKGAAALALPALLPPPFPLTPYVLTCGALQVNAAWFFSTFATMRLLRFSIAAVLGRLYGPSILRVLHTDQFQMVVTAFIVVAVVGTTLSAILLWRNAHARPLRTAT